MPKLIYDGDRMAAAILEDDDIGRVIEALRYYVSTPWGNEGERHEYERILRDLTTKAPR